MKAVLGAVRILLVPVVLFFVMVLVGLLVDGEVGAAVMCSTVLGLLTAPYWWPLIGRIRRHLDAEVEAVALAQRADAQHQAYLNGHPYGIYGDYRPSDL
ncbi:hypothetical protein Q2298_24980 [Rhodococcus electrodiphilus]|uniref:hypothetical protein n=1 Tax=Rhodococcus ruber TaxID=1830 RepID=UPI0026F454DA|nr:hypothetical protein [Rhodococcus ruber]MDO2381612.1 hypothetical protein [Rhodococcus ruber]